LDRNFAERHKWAWAYDHGGRRYGDMTTTWRSVLTMCLRVCVHCPWPQ
jgi:hypothetical protein